jgi:hypothetical protein
MSNFLLLIFSLTCIYFLQQCFRHNFHKMLLSVLMIHFTTGFIFWKKKPIWYYSLLNEISFRHLARPKFQFFIPILVYELSSFCIPSIDNCSNFQKIKLKMVFLVFQYFSS